MRILIIALLMLVAASVWGQTPSENSIPAPKDVAAPPADATKTASGLATKVIKPGTGTVHPSKDDIVTIHYNGWTTDGKLFDSSVMRIKPITFSVGRVIPGFRRAVR